MTPSVFIQPVVRAIVLALLARLRPPFEDGNGRTARALFYWYYADARLLAGRVPVDLEHPTQGALEIHPLLPYAKRDRLARHDLLHHLPAGRIQRAIDELTHTAQKVKEVRAVEKLIKGSPDFNHRQLARSATRCAIPRPPTLSTPMQPATASPTRRREPTCGRWSTRACSKPIARGANTSSPRPHASPSC